MNSIIQIKDLSNQQFIEHYAKPGCIILVSGTHFIDESIKKAQKKITKNGEHSLWSHAFIYNDIRQDGYMWIIESDLEFHRKQIKLGVQENRAEKYFDKKQFPKMAILDFNLDKAAQNKIIGEALNLVAARAQYSIREVFGVLYAMLQTKKRDDENILSRENSFFCSAFVQHCYNKIHINFNKSISTKHLTPEEIYTTSEKCTIYMKM